MKKFVEYSECGFLCNTHGVKALQSPGIFIQALPQLVKRKDPSTLASEAGFRPAIAVTNR